MNRPERLVAACALAIAIFLFLVGVVSKTVAQHALQIVPPLVASLLVARRVAWGVGAASSLFVLWLAIMVLIWLYVLGLARIVTGHFTPAEIVLTILIAAACVLGIGAAIRAPRRGTRWPNAVAFAAFAVLQAAVIVASHMPPFVRR